MHTFPLNSKVPSDEAYASSVSEICTQLVIVVKTEPSKTVGLCWVTSRMLTVDGASFQNTYKNASDMKIHMLTTAQVYV